MATTPAQKPTAEEIAAAKAEKVSEDDIGIEVSRLIAEGDEFLGVPSYVVAGAFDGVDPSTEVTVTDAKERVQKWLKAPVKQDNQEA